MVMFATLAIYRSTSGFFSFAFFFDSFSFDFEVRTENWLGYALTSSADFEFTIEELPIDGAKQGVT